MQRDQEFPDKHHQNLSTINRAGEHLLAMINDVLDMSKIEAGQLQPETTAFNLPQLLDDICTMMHARAKEKGLHFLYEAAPGLQPFVATDAGKLRQILINIMGNAVKYTDSGGVALRARTSKTEAGQLQLVVDVEDSGPGISQEQLATIFDPFVQVGNHSATQGTGLGLAIGEQLAHVLGGHIDVQSTAGKGSLFTLTLPVAVAAENDIAPVQAQRKVLQVAPGQREWRILNVEDNADNRNLLRSVLQNVGLDVLEATDGLQGVEMFCRHQPDLVWMDIRMPVMNGCEAMKKIRELPAGQNCRIIALTASAFTDQKDQMINDGFNDFLRKPYRDTEIYEALEKHLGIRFEYEETSSPQNSNDVQELTRDDLAHVPCEWRESMQRAARQGRVGEIDRLLKNIQKSEPKVANVLAGLSRDYAFKRIQEILGVDR